MKFFNLWALRVTEFVGQITRFVCSVLVTGKALDSPEKGNVDKMSENCPEGLKHTIFGHFLDIFFLFGRCFSLVTLSNARFSEQKPINVLVGSWCAGATCQ